MLQVPRDLVLKLAALQPAVATAVTVVVVVLERWLKGLLGGSGGGTFGGSKGGAETLSEETGDERGSRLLGSCACMRGSTACSPRRHSRRWRSRRGRCRWGRRPVDRQGRKGEMQEKRGWAGLSIPSRSCEGK